MSGSRDSQWYVLRRCLNIVVALLREPRTKSHLMAISADGEPISMKACDSRLQNDLKRLREALGCDIQYDRQSHVYVLHEVGMPLIDLSPDGVNGLAFLQSTFHQDAPMGDAVQRLVAEIAQCLPEERLQELRQQRRHLLLDLTPRDEDDISDAVWDAVQNACDMRQQLEFDYYSPQHDDGQPRHNLVEPSYCYFNTQRGHYYLYAYCLEVSGPKGAWEREEFVTYRMGRVSNPRVLPTRFVPRQQDVPGYELIYELSPHIARFGVTRHFPNSEVTLRDDGSAVVRAEVPKLFMSLRTLLHYGPGCRVIGGDEAVAQMRDLIGNMWSLYKNP